MSAPKKDTATHIALPHVSAVVIHRAHVAMMTHEGEIVTQQLGERLDIPTALSTAPIMACHAPWTASTIGLATRPQFDVLELFAFCHPGQFVTPTFQGLCSFFSLPLPQPDEADDLPLTLFDLCRAILAGLGALPDAEKQRCITIAQAMGRQGEGWAWTPFILSALGVEYDPMMPTNPKKDMNIFEHLPEWAEEAPPPPNQFQPIKGEEARAHLQGLIKRREQAGRPSELRAQQADYTTRIADHFAPKPEEDSPHVLVAQAGTGIGKTYGYLAPAQLWAQRNEGCVTISTYTKNLQRQIEQDLDILYPDPQEKSRKAVIQKGRENYLCLLNLEDLVTASAMAHQNQTMIAAGIMARWAATTPDGDLTGNSFPGWLTHLLGAQNTIGLADRRGECIYAACDHYHKCFIERMNRKAKRAEIVINNHALTMIRAVTQSTDATTPFIVFDEAHHVFQAADSAFGANLTGVDMADLRRWILGPEEDDRQGQGSRPTRGRGLRKRLEGLIDEDSPAYRDIGKILIAAKDALPAPGWRKRVFAHDPYGTAEKFLSAAAAQVSTRAKDAHTSYSIECDCHPAAEGMIAHAEKLRLALKRLQKPLADLTANLRAMMEDEANILDKDTMTRLDNLSAAIERRSTLAVAAWVGMVEALIKGADTEKKKEEKTSLFIDWFEITRMNGRNYDCGMFRRYKNPMEPFGNALRTQAHGVVMTSATIRTRKGDDEPSWIEAEQGLGLSHLTSLTPTKIDLPSPFHYADHSKIIIVTDIDKNNPMAVARAMKVIFEASQGGGLGLFTSVHRLRQTYHAIRDALERKSIPLYAQHENEIDIGTLTDMFREDERACLLGTDAVRDGIDVAGRSLRCMVFDRVPWPRPTILHRERRNLFGGRAYDENITRLKLKQAYGRLIRSAKDHGVFVMLDGSTPTRLLDAFPENVPIQRIKLDDALLEIEVFLS